MQGAGRRQCPNPPTFLTNEKKITYTLYPRRNPLFPIFSQNSSSNNENDFVVEEDAILYMTYSSISQIRSSISKLWGKVWHLYHFTPTQCKTNGETSFECHFANSHSRMLTKQQSHLHGHYAGLYWKCNCVKLKWYRGQTLPHSFVMDDRSCLTLQQLISKVSPFSAMKSFLMLFKAVLKIYWEKGRIAFFLGHPVYIHAHTHTHTHTHTHSHTTLWFGSAGGDLTVKAYARFERIPILFFSEMDFKFQTWNLQIKYHFGATIYSLCKGWRISNSGIFFW